MSIYSDKLAYVQVVINCRDRDAPMCTSEDALAFILGVPFIDDVMSYNLLTTSFYNIFSIFQLCETDQLQTHF